MSRIRIAALAVVAALTVPAAASAASPLVIPGPIPPAQLDVQGMMLQVQIDRAASLEKQVKDRLAAVKDRNAKIAQLQTEIQRLRAADSSAHAARIEALKAQIDALSTDSQLDLLKLQSLISKHNQASEMASNLTKKFADLKSSIIGNLP